MPARGRKDEIAAVTADELRSQLVLKKLVGKGGFAAVYLGTYKGEEVAVKVILAEHVKPDSLQVKLLLREGQYMSRCTHRCIVKCHAVCQLPADFPGIEQMGHRSSTWALVLEYIPGGSMASLLMRQMSQTRRAYSDFEAYCWVLDVAEALSYLHNAPRPVMHRDVKADNVLLCVDENGRPTAKLMDFGLMAALDGKNPMLRRRSINCTPGEALGRNSARSVGRTSLSYNLAAPSVATYYNDTTHEPGKIFYLMDELPVATVAALKTGPRSRRPSLEFTNLTAAAGGGSGSATAAAGNPNAAAAAAAFGGAATGGPMSPTTQFGFTAVASRGPSFDGNASGGSGGNAAAAAAAGGVPWGSRPTSRNGTSTGMSNHAPLGTLVPLNEEASYHGNTAGYAAMLLQQQQARRQQQAARRAESAGTGGKAASGGSASGGGTGLYHQLLQNVIGEGSAEGGRHASSLPNSLHGASLPGRSGFTDSPSGAGTTPESGSSPAGSGRWPGDPLVHPGGVKLKMVSDDVTGPPSTAIQKAVDGGGGGGEGLEGGGGMGAGGGDAAIALAAARLTRQVSERDGSLVRMSAPPMSPTRTDADLKCSDEPDCEPRDGMRCATPSDPTAPDQQQQQLHVGTVPSRPPSAARDIGQVIAVARTTANAVTGPESAEAAGSPGVGRPRSTPNQHHLLAHPNPHTLANPGSAGSAPGSFRTSHEAVPSVYVAGSRAVGVAAAAAAVGASAMTSGEGGAGTAAGATPLYCKKSRLGTSSSTPPPYPCTNRTLSAPSSGVHVQVMPAGGAPAGGVVLSTSALEMTAATLAGGEAGVAAGVAGSAVPISRQTSQRSIGSNRSTPARGFDVGSPNGAGLVDGGGAVSVTAMLQGRYEQDFQWVWRLTGQTGSCMYMAPEVFRNMPYNEKVDVFSFGVLLYEVFSRTLTLVAGLNLRELRLQGKDTPEGYAASVAGGYRAAKPTSMPGPLYELISACWADDPCDRPTMVEVVDTLRLLQTTYAPEPAPEKASCGCVIS